MINGVNTLQLPRLEITSQFAKLGIQQQMPNLEVKNRLGELQIQQPKPELEIKKTEGKLDIDQTEAFADANLKPALRLAKDHAKKAMQTVLQDVASEISEGRKLMKIENGGKDTIANIAKENTQPPLLYSNIKYIPATPDKVKFHYTPAKIDVTVTQHHPEIKAKLNSPVITHHPWDIKIYLQQKPSIEFTAVGGQYDRHI